jgi:DNA-binding FadR family transcriptional regulator
VLIESFERSRDLFFKLPNYWRVFNQPPRRARSPDRVHATKFKQYERVVRAIEARDPVAAGRAMFDHLTEVERDLIAHLEQPATCDLAGRPIHSVSPR